MYQNETNEKLLLKACKGDERAFKELYLRHKNKLYNLINTKLRTYQLGNQWTEKGKQYECGIFSSVDDIYNDIWINLMKACKHYVETTPFLPYVYKMVSNRVIDEYRIGVVRKRHFIESDDHDSGDADQDDCNVFDNYCTDNLSLETAIENEDMLNIALNLLNELPVEQKESFLLYVVGYSVDEIANITEINPETAKSRIRYAINKMRPKLERINKM